VGGLGIGLYVVHEIVTMHGGRVEVESALGVGSTFRVFLPLLERQEVVEAVR
jgi:signal transduction histidine kinase